MKVGISVECSVCHSTKQPRGRSAPLGGHYCTWDTCEGYKLEPFAGDLWPGETEVDFGYPVSLYGTRDAIEPLAPSGGRE